MSKLGHNLLVSTGSQPPLPQKLPNLLPPQKPPPHEPQPQPHQPQPHKPQPPQRPNVSKRSSVTTQANTQHNDVSGANTNFADSKLQLQQHQLQLQQHQQLQQNQHLQQNISSQSVLHSNHQQPQHQNLLQNLDQQPIQPFQQQKPFQQLQQQPLQQPFQKLHQQPLQLQQPLQQQQLQPPQQQQQLQSFQLPFFQQQQYIPFSTPNYYHQPYYLEAGKQGIDKVGMEEMMVMLKGVVVCGEETRNTMVGKLDAVKKQITELEEILVTQRSSSLPQPLSSSSLPSSSSASSSPPSSSLPPSSSSLPKPPSSSPSTTQILHQDYIDDLFKRFKNIFKENDSLRGDVEERKKKEEDMKKQLKALLDTNNKLVTKLKSKPTDNGITKTIETTEEFKTSMEERMLEMEKKYEIRLHDAEVLHQAKTKNMMNVLFKRLKQQLHQQQNYSGAQVRTLALDVIKKTTLDFLEISGDAEEDEDNRGRREKGGKRRMRNKDGVDGAVGKEETGSDTREMRSEDEKKGSIGKENEMQNEKEERDESKMMERKDGKINSFVEEKKDIDNEEKNMVEKVDVDKDGEILKEGDKGVSMDDGKDDNGDNEIDKNKDSNSGITDNRIE